VSSHAEQAAHNLALVREKRPLVHNITNYVVMQYTANALLALGASPVMAHAVDEMEEMASLANALVLNIGTLSGPWIEGMLVAGGTASRRGIPVVLDPVGAGATRLRTDTAVRLLDECRVTVLRGNASEVLAVARGAGGTRGVDATHKVEDALEAARELARGRDLVAAITGPVDHVTDGSRLLRVRNGSHRGVLRGERACAGGNGQRPGLFRDRRRARGTPECTAGHVRHGAHRYAARGDAGPRR